MLFMFPSFPDRHPPAMAALRCGYTAPFLAGYEDPPRTRIGESPHPVRSLCERRQRPRQDSIGENPSLSGIRTRVTDQMIVRLATPPRSRGVARFWCRCRAEPGTFHPLQGLLNPLRYTSSGIQRHIAY